MKLFEHLKEIQRQEEAKGKIGPLPNDAIGPLRFINAKKLCEALEKFAKDMRYSLLQLAEYVDWSGLEKTFPFTTPVHKTIETLMKNAVIFDQLPF